MTTASTPSIVSPAPDPLADRESLPSALRLVVREAEKFLGSVDEALVRPTGSPALDGRLPAGGTGSLAALEELIAAAEDGATRSTGPRFFHFVMGGVTPAALGADWLTSTLNQAAYNWVSSPLAARVEPTKFAVVAAVVITALHSDSIAVDGHEWLNAPYDTGFAFVRDAEAHAGAFAAAAAYLGTETHARPVFGNLGPEMSRRARAIPVWATLRAYGRDGYRAMFERRHLALAQRVARQVDEAPDLERLAPVPLNIICFRYRPAWRAGGGARRAQPHPRRNGARGRAGVLWHDAVRG